MKSATKKRPPVEFPSLELRIRELHAEIEELVERRVSEIAAQNPGVHRLGIRQRLLARTNDCLCRGARLITEGKT